MQDGLICGGAVNLTSKGVMSYGISSFGYDVTLANEVKLLCGNKALDPKAPAPDQWTTVSAPAGGAITIPPFSFALSYSNEYFKLPRNITGLVFPKSSYARCGLNCFQTVLEAGWEGQITLEFSNTTSLPILLYPNEGCAQVLFLEGEPCKCSYADRHGKYQCQTGITLAKVSEHD